jgi:hypothetical protein
MEDEKKFAFRVTELLYRLVREDARAAKESIEEWLVHACIERLELGPEDAENAIGPSRDTESDSATNYFGEVSASLS